MVGDSQVKTRDDDFEAGKCKYSESANASHLRTSDEVANPMKASALGP